MNVTDTLTIETPGAHAITISREFDAPVDKVFRAMTEPELIAQWMGPKYLTNVETTNDAASRRHLDAGPARSRRQRVRVPRRLPRRADPELSMRTFEWLGMPGHVSFETLRLEDLGDGRTRAYSVSVFTSTGGPRRHGHQHGVGRHRGLRAPRRGPGGHS